MQFSNEDHIYLQVAGGIEKMIDEDVLKIGDKLPSVRVLSEEYGISMGTAFQAYYYLEGKGLIESRPKSGYYVRFNNRRYPALPEALPVQPVSGNVSVKEMITSIYMDIAASDNVINLALAAPDPKLLPIAKINKSVIHALRNEKNHCINYEHTQGNVELRKQITRLAFNWGGKLKPDDIIVTSGCLEAITVCLRAVTKPGDTVAVECPVYFGIFQAVESLGLRAVSISSDPVTGMDLDCLNKAIKKFPVKAIVVVPNFNNPLGSTMPDEKKKELVAIAVKNNIPVVEDDIYGELYFGKSRPSTCKTYDTKGMVMHCSSLSKSLSPGYRIGWAIPGKFTEQVAQIKRMYNISCPTLTQSAMAHFLSKGRFEYHLKQMRKNLHTNFLRYAQSIIEHFPVDTKISRPQGGYVLWLELNKKVDAFKLRADAMKYHISVVPGKIFSSSSGYSNCIRISFARPMDEDVEYALHMLGKLVKKAQGHSEK